MRWTMAAPKGDLADALAELKTQPTFRTRSPHLSLSDLPVLLIWGGAIAVVLYALCAATWVVAP